MNRHVRISLMVVWLISPMIAMAAPGVSLVKSGTSATTTDAITQGVATYTLDLLLDTDGLSISGLQLHLITSPSEAVQYGATPVTALNNPFVAADIAASPEPGAVVRQSGGTTALFKSGAGDYAAVDNVAILSMSLDTSLLDPGQYTITPIGEEFTNESLSQPITTFAAPGSFTLTVMAAPEPASLVLMCMCAGVVLLRRGPGFDH